MLCDRRDMALRPPTGDDHIVGNQRLAQKVDGGGVNCLIFVKRFEDQLQRLLVVGLCRPAGARYVRTSNKRLATSDIVRHLTARPGLAQGSGRSRVMKPSEKCPRR